MFRLTKSLLFALCVLNTASAPLYGEEAAAPQKVLMVGNSLTYSYDIPKTLEAIARGRGKHLDITLHVAGGKGLEWHITERVKGLTAPEAITEGQYDVVVLQGDSRSIAKHGPEGLIKAAKTLHGFVAASGAGTLLYTGFVRKTDVTEQEIELMMDTYTALARELKIKCAPVALAFQRFAAANPEIAILDNEAGRRYARDKIGTHQSPFGSYLAACVIFCALYDENPSGSDVRTLGDGTELSEADAALAQSFAWETWSAYKPTLVEGM